MVHKDMTSDEVVAEIFKDAKPWEFRSLSVEDASIMIDMDHLPQGLLDWAWNTMAEAIDEDSTQNV